MSNRDPNNALICKNRQAEYEYSVITSGTETAGIVLDGWEVKSIRKGNCHIKNAFIRFIKGEAWLLGSHIAAYENNTIITDGDSDRPRKLLLTRRQINNLSEAVEEKGYTCVVLSLHLKNGRIKCDIGLAKGKKMHDKRAAEKARDWSREKNSILKKNNLI